MVIRYKNYTDRTIDIDGPAGNAHCLMGIARLWAKQMGLDSDKVIEEMSSGNYINLIKVFDKYFSGVVTLVTTNKEYMKELSVE